MDIAAVRTAAKNLRAKGEEVVTLCNGIDKIVTGLAETWKGPDSNTFRTQTWPPYKKQLTTLAEQIKQLATKAEKQASEQEATSKA
jgi:uncharacterized protein YukE